MKKATIENLYEVLEDITLNKLAHSLSKSQGFSLKMHLNKIKQLIKAIVKKELENCPKLNSK